MRRAILLMLFFVLLGSAGYMVAGRWLPAPESTHEASAADGTVHGHETVAPGSTTDGPGHSSDERSQATGERLGAEATSALGAPLQEPSNASRPDSTAAGSRSSEEWLEEADAAQRRGEDPAEALALGRALEAHLGGIGADVFDAAAPILERLRVVNERVWYDRRSSYRSRLVDPAPLTRVVRSLGQESPPIQAGVGLLARMNRLANPDIVPGDRKLRVPIDSISITVRRSSFSICVKLGEHVLDAFRAGIGKSETPTPRGAFTITEVQHLDRFQREATRWVRPEDGAVFFYGDSGFPFGKRFLRFAEPWESFGIHGTDTVDAIGAAISHGCVRMKNADVESLASWIDPGGRCAVAVRID